MHANVPKPADSQHGKGFFKRFFSSVKDYMKDCHLVGIQDESLILQKKKRSFHVPLAETRSVSLYSSSKKKKSSEKTKLKVQKSNEEFIISFPDSSECVTMFNSIEVARQKVQVDYISKLPPELLILIFSHLPSTKDLVHLFRVCTTFKKLGTADQLWKGWFSAQVSKEVIQNIELLKKGSKLVNVSWKWLCQCQGKLVRKEDTSYSGLGTSVEASVTYFGSIKAGKLDGLGIQLLKNGSLYMGTWKNDEADGTGIHLSVGARDRYEGEFRDGNFNGEGHYTWIGGEYKGKFQNGAFEGAGVCSYDDGTKYEGGFKDGKRWGFGIMSFQSGDRYEGEFCEGRRHGNGKYFFKNGDSHEGCYEQGKRHGRGIYTFSNGGKKEEKFEVVFSNGSAVQESVKLLEGGVCNHSMSSFKSERSVAVLDVTA